MVRISVIPLCNRLGLRAALTFHHSRSWGTRAIQRLIDDAEQAINNVNGGVGDKFLLSIAPLSGAGFFVEGDQNE